MWEYIQNMSTGLVHSLWRPQRRTRVAAQAGHQALHGIVHGPLGEVETPKEHGLSIQHDASRLPQGSHRRRQQLLGKVETASTLLYQLGIGAEDMAFVGPLQQQVLQAVWARWGAMLVYPHLPGYLVGGDEIDSPYIQGQPVAVPLDYLQSIRDGKLRKHEGCPCQNI